MGIWWFNLHVMIFALFWDPTFAYMLFNFPHTTKYRVCTYCLCFWHEYVTLQWSVQLTNALGFTSSISFLHKAIKGHELAVRDNWTRHRALSNINHHEEHLYFHARLETPGSRMTSPVLLANPGWPPLSWLLPHISQPWMITEPHLTESGINDTGGEDRTPDPLSHSSALPRLQPCLPDDYAIIV